jgi:carnitine monooxygenase subunit
MEGALKLVSDKDPQADWGLPGWAYRDPDYFAEEMERVIRPSWQIVCHVNDIPRPGDWRSLQLLGESIIVVRGEDGAVRAFANVCRHRGMRLLDGESGCARKLLCPYHAWAYELDGRLTGVPMRRDYPALRLEENGLHQFDLEIWQGFVFVRIGEGNTPSVAEMMASAEAEIAPFRFAEMRPLARPWARPRPVNWKNLGDNYSDNLHIPVAHDGLTRLFGRSYEISAHGWADRMSGELDEGRGGNFWERFYRAHLPAAAHLPPAYRRRWFYWKLWPNMAFDIYPDQIDYMHWVPTGPTSCLLRVASYALLDDRREMRLVRYANDRINRVVNREDSWLIEGVQQGMASRSFTAGPLAASEVCLRSFARRIREIMPETREASPPVYGRG